MGRVLFSQCSTKAKEDIEIKTVEHLLAAVAGASIDNLIIKVDNIEIPILDGSSKIYLDAIKKIGLKIQDKRKKEFTS